MPTLREGHPHAAVRTTLGKNLHPDHHPPTTLSDGKKQTLSLPSPPHFGEKPNAAHCASQTAPQQVEREIFLHPHRAWTGIVGAPGLLYCIFTPAQRYLVKFWALFADRRKKKSHNRRQPCLQRAFGSQSHSAEVLFALSRLFQTE